MTGFRHFRSPWPTLAIGVVVLAQPAAAQVLGHGADDGISWWRVVFALLLCMALAVFAAYLLRARMGGGGIAFFSTVKPDRRLKLVESFRLSHQTDLCIMACDGREMLIAVGPQETRVLRELPPRAEILPLARRN